ncbi:DUF6482 family protein [Neptuniibacter halophilus]|uniref:DUF6482 family protein n=1 Tax=Neptuniibacter halophilus TaxID=651666 RepID=UPI00257450E5|nr:DUF6482 family protein [Neptuniibacter halophilus]
MDKLQFDQLISLQPLKRVQIRSIDWSLYQVRVQTGDSLVLLYAGKAPARFNSLGQIKDKFEALQVDRFQLVRDCCSYDEMVGQPETVFPDFLETELHWKP